MDTPEEISRKMVEGGKELERFSKSLGDAEKGLGSIATKSESFEGAVTSLTAVVNKLKTVTDDAIRRASGTKSAVPGASGYTAEELMRGSVASPKKGLLPGLREGERQVAERTSLGGLAASWVKFGDEAEKAALGMAKAFGANTAAGSEAAKIAEGFGGAMAKTAAAANGLALAFAAINLAQKFTFGAQKDVMNKMAAAGLDYSKDIARAGAKAMADAEFYGIKNDEFSRIIGLSALRVPAFTEALESGGLQLARDLKGMATGYGMSLDAMIGVTETNMKRFGEGIPETKDAFAELSATATDQGLKMGDLIGITDQVVGSNRNYLKGTKDVTKELVPYARFLSDGTMSVKAFTDKVYGFTTMSVETAAAFRGLGDIPGAFEGLGKNTDEVKKVYKRFVKDTEGLNPQQIKGYVAAAGPELSVAMNEMMIGIAKKMAPPIHLKDKEKEMLANQASAAASLIWLKQSFGETIDQQTALQLVQSSGEKTLVELTDEEKARAKATAERYAKEQEGMTDAVTQITSLGKAALTSAISLLDLDKGLSEIVDVIDAIRDPFKASGMASTAVSASQEQFSKLRAGRAEMLEEARLRADKNNTEVGEEFRQLVSEILERQKRDVLLAAKRELQKRYSGH